MRNKLAAVATSLALATVMTFALAVPNAHAAAGKKVDCAKVMEELNAGKKPKEVAKDLGISRSSVYRCKKAAVGAAKEAPAAAAPAASPAPAGAK